MSIGRHAALTTGSAVLGQFLQLASLPLIAAYADPDAFGFFTLFVGGCAVLTVFAGLRYDAAIIVSRIEASARRVASLVLLLATATAALAFFLVLGTLVFSTDLSTGRAAVLAAMASSYLLANAGVRVASAWLTREARFGWASAIQFVAVAAMVGMQLVLLQHGVEARFALVGGFCIGQVVAATMAYLMAGRGRRWIARSHIPHLRAIARRHINFPKYMILYGLNSTLRERMVHAIVGWGAGATALGHMAMVQRIVGAPHAFLHGGVGPVLMSHARGLPRAEVARLASALMEVAVLALTPLFVFMTIDAVALSSTVFGARWAGVADYVPWLALTYLTLGCSGFIDRLFELYGTQRCALRLDIGFSVAIALALPLVSLSGSGVVMCATFGLIYLVYELFWTWRAYADNQLPLAPLKRALSVFAGQLVAACVAITLFSSHVESLGARALLVAGYTVASLLAHYRWLGGRAIASRLFATRGTLGAA